MKKNFGIILSIALGLSVILLTIAFQAGWVQANPFKQAERTGAPTIVSYQGQIWDDAMPYDGDGYFKFIILDGKGGMVWSNDGNPDPKPVLLQVTNGLFSVLLGDLTLGNMTSPLTADVFANPNAVLQVWFSPDGGDFTQMPDQVIAAVPYALQAEMASSADYASSASDADMLDGRHDTAFQLRVTGSCAVGQAVRTINSNGTVVCENVPKTSRFTLTSLDTGISAGDFSSVAIGTDGLPLISYYNASSGDLKVAHCNDINCTTATYTTLDSTGDVGWDTSIAIGSDGFGLISYYDNSTSQTKIVHCTNIACSTFSTPTVLATTNNPGHGSPIAIGTDGLGLIPYFQYGIMMLQIAHCTDVQCATYTSYILDGGGHGWEFPAIAIGSNGLGLIAYYDSGNGDLKVAHCTNVSCSVSFYYTVDAAGDVGYTPSITIGADGLGLISYFDLSNEDLKVAHCNTLECASVEYFTVDAAGSVGNPSSITTGVDGLGLISYYDTTNSSLKVAHCLDVKCSTSKIYTLDETGDVGLSPSATMGLDGLGIISYFDASNGDLKVAHCSNIFCYPMDGSMLP